MWCWKMLKVLLVDKTTAFAQQVAGELSTLFEVKVCTTGKEALSEYFTFHPDIIVLELELTELDGIGLLRTLRGAGHRVPVLAMTISFDSTYVQQNLIQLGVQFVLPKPCTVAAVISRVQELACILINSGWTVSDAVTSLVLHLGFSVKGVTYRYTHDALCMLAADRELSLTKVVYVEVGKRYGVSKEAVERGIRKAIENAWVGRNEQAWRCFFAPDNAGHIKKPTNAEFLHRMVIALENKKIV